MAELATAVAEESRTSAAFALEIGDTGGDKLLVLLVIDVGPGIFTGRDVVEMETLSGKAFVDDRDKLNVDAVVIPSRFAVELLLLASMDRDEPAETGIDWVMSEVNGR
jgi:hypothetical protein